MKKTRSRYIKSFQILIIIVFFTVNYFVYNSRTAKNNTNIEKITNDEYYQHSIISYNAIFNGYSKDLNSYSLRAVRASKVDKNKYILDDLTGNYSYERCDIKLKANNGSIQDSELIDLVGDVEINCDDLILKANKFRIDLVSNNVIGNGKVEASYQESNIKADNFILLNNKKKSKVNNLQFDGNVTANINLINYKK